MRTPSCPTRKPISEFTIDWSMARVERVTADHVVIVVPSLLPKPGNRGPRITGSGVFLPKKVGATQNFMKVSDKSGAATTLVIELLAIEDTGIVFAAGLKPD